MHLILVILAISGLAWPVQMASSEEFEREFTILKMEIENLKKSDMELKEKIEKMESNEGKLKEDIVKMKKKISDMERNEMRKKMDFSNLETRQETLSKDEGMKKATKAKVSINNNEDQKDDVKMNVFPYPGMENALAVKIASRDSDCCANLTTEINDIKMNMEHFNERLNDNTRKIIENQLEIQNNKKEIETNTNSIDKNANEVAINTNNIGDLMKRSEYCAYRKTWDHHTHHKIYNYDKLFLSNNFDIPGAQMDIKEGEFVAGVKGIYEIDVSLRLVSDHIKESYIYLRRNDANVNESRLHTYGNDFAGRHILLQLDDGDVVYVYADQIDTSLLDITFCVNLLK